VQRFLIDAMPDFVTDTPDESKRYYHIQNDFIVKPGVQMITGFIFRAQRYQKSELDGTMSHYSDAFPYRLDVGEFDTPIPPNFKDKSYAFFYSSNKTKININATGFNGTKSVEQTGAFDYNLVGNEFHAHFKVYQHHYPLYFSKLIMDGYIDGSLANLKIDFVYGLPDSRDFNLVEIILSRKWGDSFNIDLKNNLFYLHEDSFLFVLLIVMGWWSVLFLMDMYDSYQTMRQKNMIYTLWYKLEIGIELSKWQLMQRRRK
jgi:hypothetical protein